MKIQKTLELELDRLIEKYNFGKGWLKVLWVPDKKVPMNIITMEDQDIGAEVKEERYILIYFMSLERAVHALEHEFFEALFHSNLIEPYDTLFQSVMQAYKASTYKRKEPLIELFAKQEFEEWEEKQKKTSS